MRCDQLLDQLAAAQLGCATIAQARSCGLSADQVYRRFATGRWERLGVRTYRLAGAPPAWEQSLLAGLLDLGAGAVVSHRSAAVLHGFDGFPSGPLEFTVPREPRSLASPWCVHTTITLGLIDRARVGRYACTSAARTIVDLARSATPAELERAIDSAVRDGLVSPAFLRQRLGALRGPGRHGVRLLDEALVDAGGHSALERAFLRLVREAGLPAPTCQRIFRRDGRTVARVDFYIADPPMVVEVSGQRGHSSPSERAKDGRRRNELTAMGIAVIEFTYHDVFKNPRYVLATLRDLLP